jgi:hypothetical protein
MTTAPPGGYDTPDASALDESGHPAARSLTQLDNSQKAIRDTTKWLVAAAAAVGGVVVAGLQLSNLPVGLTATAMSLGGFTLALLGVAVIIFTAAGVLSVGFTTLGQLADLYESESERTRLERRWQERIDSATKKASRSPVGFSGWLKNAVPRGGAWIVARVLRLIRPLRIRYAQLEGVTIAELIRYLERDAIVFSNGLAADIPELYRRLRETDEEIMRLHGETPSQIAGEGRQEHVLPPEAPNAALVKAEWRLAKLETAAGTLIAFANQRIIEHRFDILKWAVRGGGIAVAVGVGLFAVAPKVAESRPLNVNRPTAVRIVVERPETFGSDCVATRLAGVALGGTWTRPIVVSEPTESCPTKRLTLTRKTGFAIPRVAPDTSPPSPPASR